MGRGIAIGLFALLCALMGCASVPNQAQDEGVLFDAGPFTVMLPPGMEALKTHHEESYGGGFVSKDIQIRFEYGFHGGGFEYWPKETVYEEVIVDGRKARIGTAGADYPPGNDPVMVGEGGGFKFKHQTMIEVLNIERLPDLTPQEKAALNAWAKTPWTIRTPEPPPTARATHGGVSNNLSLFAYCRSERDVAMAHEIFRSLRFKEGEPKL